MLRIFAAALAAALAVVFSADPAVAQTADRCAATRAGYVDIPDAPTRVTAAVVRPAEGEFPAYCEVQGYIAPHQTFELWLPANWNGKYAQVGCGGACAGKVTWLCTDPLRRGYACMTPDLGHQSGEDRLWARDNLQAQIDYGFRGVHAAGAAGRALTARHYGKAPAHSYFLGSSTGGRLAMILAQRFPWDFDGILSGVPVISLTGDSMTIMWTALAFDAQDGRPVIAPDEGKMLHEAVLAACDMNDGVKDGLIGDPRYCAFDPGTLQCNGKKQATCFTDKQIAAIRKIYSGPVTSRGEAIFTGGMQVGSELAWTNGYYDPSRYLSQADNFRNSYFLPAPPATWRPEDFNWDEDYKRLGLTESFYGAANPDLRKLKAAGARLIMFQGWADEAVFPMNNVDYYRNAVKITGGYEQTKDFFRLFMIPGMNHAGGNHAADTIDWLAYLEKWVEQAEAPDQVIGAHLKQRPKQMDVIADQKAGKAGNTLRVGADGRVYTIDMERDAAFTRPIYPFPATVKYSGQGDPNRAENFTRVDPGR